jgi:hypothetical protein
MPAIFGRRVEIGVHLRGSTTADRTVLLTVRLIGRFMAHRNRRWEMGRSSHARLLFGFEAVKVVIGLDLAGEAGVKSLPLEPPSIPTFGV